MPQKGSSGMRMVVRNYGWPLVYAVAAAVLAEASRLATGNDPISGTSLAIAAGGALLTFVASRLNPVAGKDEPFVEPHQ